MSTYYSEDVYDDESYLKNENIDGFKLKTKASNFRSLLFCGVCLIFGVILICGFLTGTYFVVNQFYIKPHTHKNVIFVKTKFYF